MSRGSDSISGPSARIFLRRDDTDAAQTNFGALQCHMHLRAARSDLLQPDTDILHQDIAGQMAGIDR